MRGNAEATRPSATMAHRAGLINRAGQRRGSVSYELSYYRRGYGRSAKPLPRRYASGRGFCTTNWRNFMRRCSACSTRRLRRVRATRRNAGLAVRIQSSEADIRFSIAVLSGIPTLRRKKLS